MQFALPEFAWLEHHLRRLLTQAMRMAVEMNTVYRLHTLLVACSLSPVLFIANTLWFRFTSIYHTLFLFRLRSSLMFDLQAFVSCVNSIIKGNHVKHIGGKWENSHDAHHHERRGGAGSRASTSHRPCAPT